MALRILLVACVVAAASPVAAGQRWTLAKHGEATVPIRLPAEPTAVERYAAEELASYLNRITGASFRIESGPGAGPSIEVGGTRAAYSTSSSLDSWEPDRWVVRVEKDRLLLYGGAPRGTLYAVYRFLEDLLGVRWWTPWDEDVPSLPWLRLGPLLVRGNPAFAYRDIFGIHGPTEFRSRRRLNGDSTGLTPERGGSLRFGPPFHVHTFDRRVSSAEHFDRHPEFFSQIEGFRVGNRTQWCLTQAALLDLVETELLESIDRGRRNAEESGRSTPSYYDVSQNDWARFCSCGPCAGIVREEGSVSAPLLRFVNELGRRIRAVHPELKLTTLAYQGTFAPPEKTRAEGNVIVRFADLYQRDFLRPLVAPSNAPVLDALRAWGLRVGNLWIWDYRVGFHEGGDLPRADLADLDRQYAAYREAGVEGVYAQTDFADVGDLHDLEVWVLTRLMEDPSAESDRLVSEFLSGYYGKAGKPIRVYLRQLERAVARTPGRLGFAPAPEEFVWLDRKFVRKAQRGFDRAERRVANDPRIVARVRGARVALDRATLARWETLWPADGPSAPWAKETIWQRYETTRRERIEQRLEGTWKQRALDDLEREKVRMGHDG